MSVIRVTPEAAGRIRCILPTLLVLTRRQHPLSPSLIFDHVDRAADGVPGRELTDL